MDSPSPIQASQFIDSLKQRAEELAPSSLEEGTQNSNDLEQWLRKQADTRRFPKSLLVPTSLYSHLARLAKRFSSSQQLLRKTRLNHEKLVRQSQQQIAQLTQTQEILTTAITTLSRKVVALEAQISSLTNNPLPTESQQNPSLKRE